MRDFALLYIVVVLGLLACVAFVACAIRWRDAIANVRTKVRARRAQGQSYADIFFWPEPSLLSRRRRSPRS